MRQQQEVCLLLWDVVAGVMQAVLSQGHFGLPTRTICYVCATIRSRIVATPVPWIVQLAVSARVPPRHDATHHVAATVKQAKPCACSLPEIPMLLFCGCILLSWHRTSD
jgi:hypothetical protein